MNSFQVVLVGAGGYGRIHLELLTTPGLDDRFTFAGIIDPFVTQCKDYPMIVEKNIPCFDTLEDYFADHVADLVIISTPIHLHKEQAITAMQHGAHVLCEKPVTPLCSQAIALQEAAEQYQKLLAVGFQWSFSDVMLQLKQNILAGEYGKPLSLKSYISWPRGADYYKRSWAGKKYTAQGDAILDSIASNATAHYIHNMLFLLGDALDTSAPMEALQYASYRANAIENYDTLVFRGRAGGDCKLFFAASHCTNYNIDPVAIYEFEQATIAIHWNSAVGQCVVHKKNGEVIDLGNVDESAIRNKFLHMLDAMQGKRTLSCTIKTVLPHLQVVNAIAAADETTTFAPEYVIKTPTHTYVKNLHLDLYRCFAEEKLPSELGFCWAKPETTLTL